MHRIYTPWSITKTLLWAKAMKSDPLLGHFCGSEFWGQQQNETKLAYLSNGVDKQQKLPKRGLKTLVWSHKKHFQ